MTTLRETAQQALEALEHYRSGEDYQPTPASAAITALRAALVEPVQEPVAKVELMTTGGNAGLATRIVEIDDHLRDRLRPGQLLYTAPPQRKPLTETEMYAVEEEATKSFRLSQQGVRGQQITYWDSLTPWLIRAAERAHGIGGAT